MNTYLDELYCEILGAPCYEQNCGDCRCYEKFRQEASYSEEFGKVVDCGYDDEEKEE